MRKLRKRDSLLSPADIEVQRKVDLQDADITEAQ